MLGEFAKCVLFWSGKEASGFERSVPEQVHFEIALVTALAGTRRGGTSAIYCAVKCRNECVLNFENMYSHSQSALDSVVTR